MSIMPQGNNAMDPRDAEAIFKHQFGGLSPAWIEKILGVPGPLPPIEGAPSRIPDELTSAFSVAPQQRRPRGTFQMNMAQASSQQKNKLNLQGQLKLALPQVKQTIQESSGQLNTLGLNQPTTGEGLFTARMAPQPDVLSFLKSYATPKSWTNVGKISPHNLVGNRW